MRGIDPASNTLVDGDEARIRQAFANMKTIAASEGASLQDCVRLTVFVTDMGRLRPLVNKVQEELWAGGPYPPRTIVEVREAQSGRHFRGGRHFLRPGKGLDRARISPGFEVAEEFALHISREHGGTE